MLSTAARARLSVVLVGARNPQNIGAAARAMHDFGFNSLRLVNDYAAPFEAAQLEAVKSAVASEAILRSARAFLTLAEAIADCTLVIGTTAIGERTLAQAILPMAEAAATAILPSLAINEGRVALLFGSEKTGLTNDHLSHCHWLTTIPMFDPAAEPGAPRPDFQAPDATDPSGRHTRHLSMNLGQSVAVCLYELTRTGFEHSKEIPATTPTPATAADRERLTQLLLDVMHVTEYTRRFPANAQEPQVRQLTQALGRDHHEAETWMGILRQILWSQRQG